MKKLLKTVKARIIAMMLCFALAVTLMVVVFSYYLIYDYQTRTTVQSTTANLQLISQSIERDLVDIIALANWCSTSSDTYRPGRYLASGYDAVLAVECFNRLHQEYGNNRAYEYISRLLVVSNTDGSRVLHTGKHSSNSTLSFLDTGAPSPIEHYSLEARARIYDIGQDPYARVTSVVINILGPVMNAPSTRVVGTVYLAADTQIITDALKGYSQPNGGTFYLSLGSNVYRIENKTLSLTGELGEIEPAAAEQAEGPIAVGKVHLNGHTVLDAVRCQVREGVYLTQVFDLSRSLPSAGSWLSLALGICLLVLLLSLLAIWTLNRTISLPVKRIRQKMSQIAEGDFTPEPSIESDSEIGEVGRGINMLARDIVGLMESRLADEQQKRELEYRMLQSQINPHFLYNTLGTIKWMASLQKADGIAEMTTALSRLLKTVAKDLRKEVPLRDELALLEDYYTILKYRYGGTVTYQKLIEDQALLACKLPRFVLQPLMENAIFHGIEPKGHGKIVLHIRRHGGDVYLSLTDNGVGMPPQALAELTESNQQPLTAAAHTSVGMRSVNQRIKNVFGPAYGLSAESQEGQYTKITLHIPFNTA